MNAIRLAITFGVLLCLFACHRTPHYPSTLLRAEQLMDVASDSALILLAGFKDSVRAESEATQMYYQLLTVKANDKCYIPHTSDSLIKVLVNYRRFPNQFYLPYTARSDVYRELDAVVYDANNNRLTDQQRIELQAQLNNGNPNPPYGGRIPNDF